MNRSYFEEVQTLRQNRWIWILMIITSMGAMLPLIYGMYWQIGEGLPWGHEPMSDVGLILMFLLVICSMAVCFWMLLATKLEIKINDKGVHYKFFPNKCKWSLISKEEIDTYEVRNYYNFFESGCFGYHNNWFLNTRSIRITGNHHLLLTMKNSRKFLLGTQDPGGVEHAMRKLLHKNEMN